jgi:hypothetical protein
VAINTVKPKRGVWVCDVHGAAKGNGATLAITIGEDSFSAKLADANTLGIDASDPVFAVARKCCGMSGGFAYTCRRASM